MKENKTKGRPAKEQALARRAHFSVWVTHDEKARINSLVERSGLSASQFFLTLALDTPIKRPQRKTLPVRTAEMIRTLEQLSGILSLAVLKTKDNQMQSRQWQQSSQSVRLLSKLIMLWVFEDFEIRSTRKTLAQIQQWTRQLHGHLQTSLDPSPNKDSILEKTSSACQSAAALLEKYERYYQPAELVQLVGSWKPGESAQDPAAVHGAIQEALAQTLKQVRP